MPASATATKPAPKTKNDTKSNVTPFVKAPALKDSRINETVQVRNSWSVTCDMNTTVEQVLDESYWANVSMKLRPGDVIAVMPPDMSWELGLHVSGAGKLYAHVIQRYFYNLAPSKPPIRLPSIYKVDFGGTVAKFRVLRKGVVLKDGFETKPLAERYALNHEDATTR